MPKVIDIKYKGVTKDGKHIYDITTDETKGSAFVASQLDFGIGSEISYKAVTTEKAVYLNGIVVINKVGDAPTEVEKRPFGGGNAKVAEAIYFLALAMLKDASMETIEKLKSAAKKLAGVLLILMVVLPAIASDTIPPLRFPIERTYEIPEHNLYIIDYWVRKGIAADSLMPYMYLTIIEQHDRANSLLNELEFCITLHEEMSSDLSRTQYRMEDYSKQLEKYRRYGLVGATIATVLITLILFTK